MAARWPQGGAAAPLCGGSKEPPRWRARRGLALCAAWRPPTSLRPRCLALCSSARRRAVVLCPRACNTGAAVAPKFFVFFDNGLRDKGRQFFGPWIAPWFCPWIAPWPQAPKPASNPRESDLKSGQIRLCPDLKPGFKFWGDPLEKQGRGGHHGPCWRPIHLAFFSPLFNASAFFVCEAAGRHRATAALVTAAPLSLGRRRLLKRPPP